MKKWCYHLSFKHKGRHDELMQYGHTGFGDNSGGTRLSLDWREVRSVCILCTNFFQCERDSGSTLGR